MPQLQTNEDNLLLAALKKDDQKAFDCLFRKYYPLLCAYAHRFVSLEDAEGVVQEVMIWLWEKRDEDIITTSLSSYLFRMTHNRCLNRLAQQERMVSMEDMIGFQLQQMDDVDAYQVRELAKRIKTAIQELPESYRTPFVMHRFKGMDYKSIAEVLEVSTKTVDYRMQRALKQLRNDLKDYLPFWVLMAFTS